MVFKSRSSRPTAEALPTASTRESSAKVLVPPDDPPDSKDPRRIRDDELLGDFLLDIDRGLSSPSDEARFTFFRDDDANKFFEREPLLLLCSKRLI